VAPPFKVAEFDILYGKGISRLSEIIDFGVTYDIISKSGAWFAYNGERIAQGKDNARAYLENNLDIAAEIDAKIREAMKNSEVKESTEFDVADDDDFDIDTLGIDE
jgi:recombination protein RecA